MQRACLEVIEQRLFAGNLLIPAAGGMISALDAGEILFADVAAAAPELNSSAAGATLTSNATPASAEPPAVPMAAAPAGDDAAGSSSADSGSAPTVAASSDFTDSLADFSPLDAPLGSATEAEGGGDPAATVALPPDGFRDGDRLWLGNWQPIGGTTNAGGDLLIEWPADSTSDGNSRSSAEIADSTTSEGSATLIAPTNLTATPRNARTIDLLWSDNSSDETGFKIERSSDGGASWSEIATVSANVTSYSAGGLDFASTHNFRIRSYNSDGDSDYSNTVSATTYAVPTPNNMTAQVISSSQIDMTWVDYAPNEDGFRIERSSDGGSTWSEIDTVAADSTSYSATGLTAGTTYFFRVRGYISTGGTSAYSAPVSATTLGPAAPTNLMATPRNARTIDLRWSDNSNNEIGFRVERSSDGGASWSEIGTVSANSTSYSAGGLDFASTHSFRVRAYNGDGESNYSNTFSATTYAVPTPNNMTAQAISSSQINITWVDYATNEDGFRIERSSDGGSTWSEIDTVPADSISYSATALAAGTTYSFRVRGYTSTGGYSAYSAPVSATTHPGPAAPANLTATPRNARTIDLKWSDNSADESGFGVEMSSDGGSTWSQIATVAANNTSYSAGNLEYGSTHSFRIRSYNGSGDNSYSDAVTATTYAVPTPNNMTAQAISSSQIDLTWVDYAPNEDGFRIERSSDGGSTWSEIDTVPANTTSYSVTGLSAATAYLFRVRGYMSGGGYSAYSAPVSADTEGALTAPSGLAAPSPTDRRVDLVWQDNSSDEKGFWIERDLVGDQVGWLFVATVGENVTSYTHLHSQSDPIVPATQYSYRVRAYNDAGHSNWATVTLTTAQSTTPPETPTNLHARVWSESRIDILWKDNSDDETGFIVERRTEQGTWVELPAVAPNGESISADGLALNTTYDFRVKACNAAGSSGWLGPVTISTAALATPADFRVTTIRTTGLDLAWRDTSAQEGGFRIEQFIGGQWTAVVTTGPNEQSASIDDLEPNTTYVFRVCAFNDAAVSAWTLNIRGTTYAEHADDLLAVPASPTSVELTWTGTQSTTGGFTIEYWPQDDPGSLQTAASSATATTIADLRPATTYVFQVRCNSGNTTWSNTASATTPLAGETLFPTKDLYVRDGTSPGEDYRSISYDTGELLAKESNPPDSGFTRRSYLGFRLSDLADAGANFNSVTLWLSGVKPNEIGADPQVHVYEVPDDTWLTSSTPVTWLNRPPVGVQLTGTPLTIAGNNKRQWYTVDLTDYVRQVLAQGRQYLGLCLQAAVPVDSGAAFRSANSATNRPRLVVETGVDLDIDSDNTDGFDTPGRTPEEEQVEDQKAGKLVVVNRDDSDGDGIPDFADGFGAFDDTSTDSTIAGEQFVPVVLQLPAGLPQDATIEFTYDAADPSATSRTGISKQGLDGETYVTHEYHVGTGLMRLWRKAGDAARTADDFVAPDTAYSLADLGLSGTDPLPLYLETVNGSATATAITVTVHLPSGASSTDTIRVLPLDPEVGIDPAQELAGYQVFRGNGSSIIGSPDNDILIGTDAAEYISALGGDDIILPGGGNDQIDAGDGSDVVIVWDGSKDIAIDDGDRLLYFKSGRGEQLQLSHRTTEHPLRTTSTASQAPLVAAEAAGDAAKAFTSGADIIATYKWAFGENDIWLQAFQAGEGKVVAVDGDGWPFSSWDVDYIYKRGDGYVGYEVKIEYDIGSVLDAAMALRKAIVDEIAYSLGGAGRQSRGWSNFWFDRIASPTLDQQAFDETLIAWQTMRDRQVQRVAEVAETVAELYAEGLMLVAGPGADVADLVINFGDNVDAIKDLATGAFDLMRTLAGKVTDWVAEEAVVAGSLLEDLLTASAPSNSADAPLSSDMLLADASAEGEELFPELQFTVAGDTVIVSLAGAIGARARIAIRGTGLVEWMSKATDVLRPVMRIGEQALESPVGFVFRRDMLASVGETMNAIFHKGVAIVGTAQVTANAGHAETITRWAKKIIDDNPARKYLYVGLNRSLRTMVADASTGVRWFGNGAAQAAAKWRPDMIAVYWDEVAKCPRIELFEVASAGQTSEQLIPKLEQIMNLLPEAWRTAVTRVIQVNEV